MMDLLNMTNRAQISEFYNKLYIENFIFQATVSTLKEIFIFQATNSKFGDLLAGWKLDTNAKFQLNISKIMPARPKKTET